jgi:hypothetical protein
VSFTCRPSRVSARQQRHLKSLFDLPDEDDNDDDPELDGEDDDRHSSWSCGRLQEQAKELAGA